MTSTLPSPSACEQAIREALAAGPTSGQWTTAKSYGSGARCSVKAGLARIAVPSVTNINWEANAALIAACNPENIAAMLAEIDSLRAALTAASKQEGGEPIVAWRYRIRGGAWEYQEAPFFAGGTPGPREEHQALTRSELIAALSAPQPPLAGAGEANMFWNDADPERSADSIHEVIEREWSDGLLQIGDVIEIQRAARLSNIRVELVPDPKDEDGFDYEIMPQSVTPQPAPLNGGCGDGESAS